MSNQESLLHTEPSFCIYTDDEFGEQVGNIEPLREKIERTATIGDNIEAEFSFAENEMRMIEEDKDEDGAGDEEGEEASIRFKDLKIEIGSEQVSPPIHQAKRDGADAGATLNKWRNHAQYLESTGDLYGAEENYFQAIEADPNDGDVLSQYAKLVWQLHGDRAKATRYFEKATVAAPANSDVLAAYASFLWDIDENEEEERLSDDVQVDETPDLVDALAGDYIDEMRPSSPPLHLAMGLGINGAGFGDFDAVDYMNTTSDTSTNDEEYYRRMVEGNPRNAGFLRDYAVFLHQKGDLQGAKEYYSRGILEDPRDGQMLSQYAGILWQLHCDKDRAVTYFERAVEASPDHLGVEAEAKANTQPGKSKFTSRSSQCVYLGPAANHKGYLLYDLSTFKVSPQTLTEDVRDDGSLLGRDIVEEPCSDAEVELVDETFSDEVEHIHQDIIQEPTSYKEASKHPEWIKAMDSELEALERNATWEIMSLPEGLQKGETRRSMSPEEEPLWFEAGI